MLPVPLFAGRAQVMPVEALKTIRDYPPYRLAYYKARVR